MQDYSVQRYKETLTIDVGEDADEIVSAAVEFNGLLRGVVVTAPELDGSDTFTITIKDADGNTLWSQGTLSEDATHAFYDYVGSDDTTLLPMMIPLSGNHTITVTASGNQDADREFSVVLLIERG